MTPVAGRGRWILLVGLVGASLVQAAAAAVVAWCIQRVFDGLLSGDKASLIASSGVLGSIFAASAGVAALLEIFRFWLGEKLGLGYVAEVRVALFEKVMRASAAEIAQRREGGLMLPFVGDLTAVKKWVSDGLVRLISAGATAILLLGALAFESVQLAIAAAAVMAVAAIAVILLNGPLSRAIQVMRARRAAVANFVSGSIRAAQTVQAFDRQRREAERLRKRNDALMESGLKLASVAGLVTAIVHLAAVGLVAVTLVVGVIEVQRGAMTIGLVAGAISLAGMLAGAVRDLGTAFDLWRRAKVSFNKIARSLAISSSVSEKGARRLRGEPHVRFDDVGVEGLFQGVSLEAANGAVINVVGESGSGKSTLLSLVARLRDPDMGRVRINGRNARSVDLAALRRHIGLASATTPLMRGSLGMNLRYRAPNASAAEVSRMIEVCNIAPVLARLPGQEEARLGEGAPELSIGETQRVLIARAMLGAPPILILDAVDTHLDAETAARIAKEISAYPGIVLMAATKPELRNVATAVWKLENGAVTAEALATSGQAASHDPEIEAVRP